MIRKRELEINCQAIDQKQININCQVVNPCNIYKDVGLGIWSNPEVSHGHYLVCFKKGHIHVPTWSNSYPTWWLHKAIYMNKKVKQITSRMITKKQLNANTCTQFCLVLAYLTILQWSSALVCKDSTFSLCGPSTSSIATPILTIPSSILWSHNYEMWAMDDVQTIKQVSHGWK